MPNSLRSKLSKLRYKRQISDEEYRELTAKLDGHDKELLDKIRAEIERKARPNEIGGRGNEKSIRYGLCIALEIIDKYKAESEDKE